MSTPTGFEVREFTIWRVVCHIPGCPWSQRHDDPEAARLDGANHVAEWHGLDAKGVEQHG